MINKISSLLQSSEFFTIFNFKDDLAKGRTFIYISSFLTTIINTLTTGIFYTGFLLINDIDIVNIGFLGSIPYITSLFSLLTPAILNRFTKRKTILRISKILYYTLNIAGITIIPLFKLPQGITYAIFVLLIFISSAIKFAFESGFQSWEADLLPSNVRAGFFSIRQITNGALSSVTVLISGIITDSVRQSSHQLTVMASLRIFAFVLAIIEAIIITSPKEFPQKNTDITWKSLLIIPFKYKKFIFTMLFVIAWNFGTNVGITFYDVYILDTVKVSYTVISAINASNCIFIFLFTPMWKRFLHKHNWLRTFALTALMHAPTIFLNGFVNRDNYMWLYVGMRLMQHFVGVGLNLAFANMAFINLPEQDKTNCLSFYILISNIGAFFGQFIGSLILASTKNFTLTMFGYTYNNVIIVTTLESIILTITALSVLKFGPKLDHKTSE